MARWSRVEAFLDKEVQRETKRILAKAKAAMGLGNGHSNGTVTAKPKRKVKIINIGKKDIARARRTHGQYLGLTRRLTPGQKAHVKALRANEGIRAAISEAKRLRALD